MSTDDRTQALQEIDFCRSQLPMIWVKYKNGPKQLRPAYRNILDNGFLMLDAAVSKLLAADGVPSISPRR